MKKFGPMFLIWITMGLSVLELLSTLQLVLIDLRFALSIVVVLTFVISIGWGALRFKQDSQRILGGISTWDEEMKQDIPNFLQARKIRLMTSLVMVSILLVFKFIPTLMNQTEYQEIFMYIFVIGLFHVALVSSLILFKMSRTVGWIEHENYLATLEKA